MKDFLLLSFLENKVLEESDKGKEEIPHFIRSDKRIIWMINKKEDSSHMFGMPVRILGTTDKKSRFLNSFANDNKEMLMLWMI